MFYVYLLKSLLHNEFYVGSANDLKKRMKDHNLGKVFSTKRYMPWKLLYYEAYLLEKFARIREQRLKRHGNALRQVKQRIGIYENSAGFTLVELLASIVALVAVGSVIAGIITASLRGTNKTNAIENIRQNGNYAISQVSKNIEYAQIFNGFSDDGTTYVTTCPSSSNPSPTPPAPVTTEYKFVKVTGYNGSSITYSCTYAPTFTVTTANAPTPAPLIDANSVALVDCSIACIQTRATDVPVIKISLQLSHRDPNGLVESSTPPIRFETSVTVRNYKK